MNHDAPDTDRFRHHPESAVAVHKCDGSCRNRHLQWVDKNGETHFSQLPPKQGEAQQIDPDYATPIPSSGESTGEPAAPAPKKDTLKPDQTITVLNKAEAQKACAQAKEQMNMLRDPKNQPMVQEKDGKYRPLTAEEIAGRIKQAEEVANKACVGQ